MAPGGSRVGLGIQLQARETGAARCPLCWDGVEADDASCGRCQARWHADCLEELSREARCPSCQAKVPKASRGRVRPNAMRRRRARLVREDQRFVARATWIRQCAVGLYVALALWVFGLVSVVLADGGDGLWILVATFVWGVMALAAGLWSWWQLRCPRCYDAVKVRPMVLAHQLRFDGRCGCGFDVEALDEGRQPPGWVEVPAEDLPFGRDPAPRADPEPDPAPAIDEEPREPPVIRILEVRGPEPEVAPPPSACEVCGEPLTEAGGCATCLSVDAALEEVEAQAEALGEPCVSCGDGVGEDAGFCLVCEASWHPLCEVAGGCPRCAVQQSQALSEELEP